MRPPPAQLHGAALVVHLAEVLVQERLYRDLREAHATNAALARLDELIQYPHVRAAVLEAMGWRNRRHVEIVEIRPRRRSPAARSMGSADRRFETRTSTRATRPRAPGSRPARAHTNRRMTRRRAHPQPKDTSHVHE